MPTQYSELKELPGGTTLPSGWKVVAFYPDENFSVLELAKDTPSARLSMELLQNGSLIDVRDKASKAAYRLFYAAPGNLRHFYHISGRLSSDFMRRSWEAARQLGFQKKIYQP
jgi:hypothetical protein